MPPRPSPRLDARDADTFRSSVNLLEEFNKTAPALRTQNFAAAIAILLHRSTPESPSEGVPRQLHRPDSGDLLGTRDLQVLVCDRAWAKEEGFRPAADKPILKPFAKPFDEAFKGPSPGVNNWRNSFDLQSGLGCDAPYTADFLRSEGYLGTPRFDCPFRDPDSGHCLSAAGHPGEGTRTCFNPNKRDVPPGPGDTDAQHTPRLLTRGTLANGRAGYWFVEPTPEVLADLVGDPEVRVPLYPFASALYGGSEYFAEWGTEVSRERLEGDLALSPENFLTLFDPDPESTFNAAILNGSWGGTIVPPTVSTTSAAQELSAPVAFTDRSAQDVVFEAGRQADPARRRRLLERATQGHRRTMSTLAWRLEEAGYEIEEQLDGFDLRAVHPNHGDHLFEVKSWTQANLARQVRSGWAQLKEYRYRNSSRLQDDVRLYLVLDRLPPEDYWAWDFLVEVLGVVPCWIEDAELRTFEGLEGSLPPLS